MVTWFAEDDVVLEAKVRGFSAMVGKGRLILETLGPRGERVAAHRRLLAPGGTLAQVGALWVDEPNLWDLVLEPGRPYEVRSRPGTAGPISLAVLGPADAVLASASPTPDLPYPSLRFTAPGGSDGSPPTLRLEVRALDGGGGTYGVRLHADPPALPDPPPAVPPAIPPRPSPPAACHPRASHRRPPGRSAAGAGRAARLPAGPGDLAFLHLPRSDAYDPHWVQRLDGDRWTTLATDGTSVDGRRATMRTPEGAALAWFRPGRTGIYRFVEPPGSGAVLQVVPAAQVPAAPLLIGTGMDPSVPARGTSQWRAIGAGVRMPGWDYLYVAVGRRPGSVGMRVKEVGEPTGAVRSKTDGGLGWVRGLGPSYRFRVTRPVLVRPGGEGRGLERLRPASPGGELNPAGAGPRALAAGTLSRMPPHRSPAPVRVVLGLLLPVLALAVRPVAAEPEPEAAPLQDGGPVEVSLPARRAPVGRAPGRCRRTRWPWRSWSPRTGTWTCTSAPGAPRWAT